MKRILSIIASLFLTVAAMAASVSIDTTYHSRFIDKGSIPYRGALVTAVAASAGSFNGEIKAYVPTLLSQTDIKSAFARYDFTGGYTMDSTLFSATSGATLTHVNKTPTLGHRSRWLSPHVLGLHAR